MRITRRALQVFEGAVVRRVDHGLGLLLELPAGEGGAPLTPGYAHVSNLADDKVEEVGKVGRAGGAKARPVGGCPYVGTALPASPGRRFLPKPPACLANCLRRGWQGWCMPRHSAHAVPYRPLPQPPPIQKHSSHHILHAHTGPLQRYRLGQRLRARVLGFRPMDGLAALSLKPSVVDQSILSLAGEGGPECFLLFTKGRAFKRMHSSLQLHCSAGAAPSAPPFKSPLPAQASRWCQSWHTPCIASVPSAPALLHRLAAGHARERHCGAGGGLWPSRVIDTHHPVRTPQR